jgi:hypothetical protein
MEYQDGIVCFLDILGFREHISQSLKEDGSDSPQKIEQLAEAINRVREIFDVDHPEHRVGGWRDHPREFLCVNFSPFLRDIFQGTDQSFDAGIEFGK